MQNQGRKKCSRMHKVDKNVLILMAQKLEVVVPLHHLEFVLGTHTNTHKMNLLLDFIKFSNHSVKFNQSKVRKALQEIFCIHTRLLERI